MNDRPHDMGDGDLCPQDETHGYMYFNADRSSQWCPSARHTGNARYAYDGVTPRPLRSAPESGSPARPPVRSARGPLRSRPERRGE